MKKFKQIDITRERALKLLNDKWWEKRKLWKVFEIQLRIKRLIMDFSHFHEIAEKALDRPVWTHEFVNPELLYNELHKMRNRPDFNEIVSMLPQDKVILVIDE